jgi:predicted transposase/invertase (TIGR01784 family)
MKNEENSRYLNMLTDFGFKRILAQDESKPLLIHLLNVIIEGWEKIVDVLYLRSEQLGKRKEDRKAIYDIYCENDRGDRLIIEMQVGKQLHFMDRCLYYATFPIRSQAKKGKWNYKLKPVYIIAILDFVHDKSNDNYINCYSIMNEKEHKRISNSLIFITIELPKFKKAIGELTNELEAWLYCFCNLPEMEERPAEIKGPVFDLLFEIAEMNKLTSEEMEVYRKSVAEYADVQLMMACSLKEGRDEGIEEGIQRGMQEGILKGILKGKREGKKEGKKEGMQKGILKGKRETMNEIAQNLLKMNFPMTDITKITGLTPEQVLQL